MGSFGIIGFIYMRPGDHSGSLGGDLGVVVFIRAFRRGRWVHRKRLEVGGFIRVLWVHSCVPGEMSCSFGFVRARSRDRRVHSGSFEPAMGFNGFIRFHYRAS